MKQTIHIFLVSLCLIYSFITQAALPQYGHGKVDINAYQRSLSTWDDSVLKSNYENIDELHKDLTGIYEKNGKFTFVDAFKPGQSALVDYKDDKKITIHKPTLDERKIILKTLKTRTKDLPDTPENIADLIYIIDSDMGIVAGFYSSKYHKIFIPQNQLTNPSMLLFFIIHEYTHYIHMIGHQFASRLREEAQKELTGKKLFYDNIYEEARADNSAIEIVNCAGCGGEIIANAFGKDTHKKDRNRLGKAEAKKTGYTHFDAYTDEDTLAYMKPFCSNCLQTRKVKLKKTPGGINTFESKRALANATQINREHIDKIRAEYYASKKDRDYISDEFLY